MAVKERLLASVVATDQPVYLGGGSFFAGAQYTVFVLTGGGAVYTVLVEPEELDLQQ